MRIERGALTAPLLRLWAALDGRTDRFALYRLYMAADDVEEPLNALLTGPDFAHDVFIALTKSSGVKDVFIPELFS